VREVLKFLLECRVVVGWDDAVEHRLVCDLRDAVRAARCGFQAALWLAGEVGLYGEG
jgi:hypothetical protein